MSERDYIDRTIATVRNHRGADNCWPQWLADTAVPELTDDVATEEGFVVTAYPKKYTWVHKLHVKVPRESLTDPNSRFIFGPGR